MSDMDDYFAFMCSNSKPSTDGSSGSGNAGCSSGCLTWVISILAFFWLVGKLVA